MNTEVESGTVEPTVPVEGAPEAQPVNEQQQQSDNAAATTSEPQSWEELGVKPELRQTLLEMGFLEPMAVQRAVFPRMMAGKDVMVQSRTGSGKTAAFGIPFAQGLIDRPRRRRCRRSCLAPTRELALQVGASASASPPTAAARDSRSTAARRWASRSSSSTRAHRSSPARRGACSITCGAGRCASTALQDASCSTRPTRCCRWASSRRSPRSSSAARPSGRRCSSRPPSPRTSSASARRYMREPEKIQLSADFVGVHEITHRYYMVSGMGRGARSGARARGRGARVGDHLLQHARGDRRWSPSSCASSGHGRRGDLERSVAEATASG